MDPVIAKGTCFPAFAFDVARAIDLDAAERRILAGTERQTVKQRRRAPANFEYRPAPLRVTRQGEAHVLGAYRTAPTLELVLYDFGAISASYAVSIEGPLMGLPALAYELLQPLPTRIGAPGREGPDLRRLARLQLDGAILFEQVTNALKLVGDQYLARVYSLASRRFHLGEWDASITRKLQTIDSIYAKMADRTASRRMEILEWIIIVLIAVSIILSVVPVLPRH